VTTCDVVVVGAGAVGAATSFRLARNGHSVELLDPDPMCGGGGATTASGAMLGVLGEVTGPDDPCLALRLAAGERYAAWLDELGEAGGAPPPLGRGTFVVASTRHAGDVTALDAIEDAAIGTGLGSERLDPADVSGLAPATGYEPARVLSLPDEGFVDARSLRAAVVDAARGVSVQVRAGRVARLLLTGERVVGVELEDKQRIMCGHVVLCVGAVAGPLLRASGLPLDMVPITLRAKGVGVVLEPAARRAPPTDYVLRTPNRAFACGLHLVPVENRAVYTGATNRVSRLDGVLGGAAAGEVAQVLTTAAAELHHQLATWHISSVRYGVRALTLDGVPVAGETLTDGLLVAGGAYRNGVLLAPLLADSIGSSLDNGTPDPRLTPHRMPPAADVDALLVAGREQLAEMLRDPLDDVAAAWVNGLLVALDRVLEDPSADAAVRLRSLLERYPRIEMVPEALVEALEDSPSGAD
jgi:glycine/D-amino acid oxidase-like deaminating enzyme